MLQRRKNSSLITDFFRQEGVKRNAVELIKRESERSCLFNAMFCFMYGRPSKCLIGVLQKLLNFFTMLWTSQRCQFVAFIVFLVCCTTNSIFGIDWMFVIGWFLFLQLYNFGETVSIVFWTDTWKPESFFDKIKKNRQNGMHTLCLLGKQQLSWYLSYRHHQGPDTIVKGMRWSLWLNRG